MGPIKKPAYFKEVYAVDEAMYVDELAAWLKGQPAVHVNAVLNSDSGVCAIPAALPDGASADGLAAFDDSALGDCLAECRVVKSDAEREAMRYATYVCCYTVLLCTHLHYHSRPLPPSTPTPTPTNSLLRLLLSLPHTSLPGTSPRWRTWR